MRMSRGARGASLGSVLICMVVLTTLLFIAVSASVSHLQMVTAAENQEHARNLADSAIAEAIHRISTAAPPEPGNNPADVSVSIDGVEGFGTITFDSSVEPRGYSVYNINGESAVSGTRGRVVPPRTVHLVGKGQVGSAISYVECLYYRPPFPDGLIATGPVKASALELYGIRRDDAYVGGDPGAIPSEDVLPGNLYSNYTDGWDATSTTVRLSDESDVSGSLGAVGTVTVDATSVVGGEVLPGSSPRPMASLDVQAKIDALKPNAIPVTGGGPLELDPDWFSISSGDLSVNGELNLNGSALLVEGDLLVDGKVTGTGVVLVNGEVEIVDRGSTLEAEEQTAIACTDNFTLTGNGKEASYFKGLVYCQGDFYARNITVVGATVVNAENNAGARGQAELDNVRFVYHPGSVTVGVSTVLGVSDNDSDYTYSFKIMVRRNSANDGYDVISTLYSSTNYGDEDEDDGGSKGNEGTPLVWSIPERVEQSFDPVSILDSELNTGKLGDILENLIEVQLMENGPLEDRSDDMNLEDFKEEVKKALDGLTGPTPGTSVVTLNLNSLLGEFLSTSRVVLWRPLEDSD